MKKTILLSFVFAVGAASAETNIDSSVIGALPADVAAASQQLMAVPFVGIGSEVADGTIAINDLVKTSDLADGDKLYVANDNGYDIWVLTDGEWVAANKVTIKTDGTSVEGESPSSEEGVVNRGDAFWLETKNAGKVILLGGKDEAERTFTAKAGKWNLISNPTISEANLSEGDFVTNDRIAFIIDGKVKKYTWDGNNLNGWWERINGRREKVQIKVPAGMGVWFYVAGDEDRTINW